MVVYNATSVAHYSALAAFNAIKATAAIASFGDQHINHATRCSGEHLVQRGSHDFERMQTWPLWHVAPENIGTRPSAAGIFARKHCHRCRRVTFIFAKRKKVTRRRLRRATAPALAERGPTKSDARVFAPTFRNSSAFFAALCIAHVQLDQERVQPTRSQKLATARIQLRLIAFFDPRRRSFVNAILRQPTVHLARMSATGGWQKVVMEPP